MNEQELYVLLEGGEELPIKDLKDPVLFRLDTHTELCTVGVDWDKAVWKVRNDVSFSLTVFYGRDEETRKERTGALGPEE